ncbi:MAG: class I SAM-dependent methyltransferase [Sulfitobacter sp.]
MTELNTNLFGEVIHEDPILRDRFIEPPFSVLDTKTGSWQNRKRAWAKKGLKSEVGRNASVINMGTKAKKGNSESYVSIFDPALCEVLYHWFCPSGGMILDPFAGGSVRGIVANFLGYKYTGIDIRQEQIDSNRDQASDILAANNQPNWYVGDSDKVLDEIDCRYDFVFSCPPYADLEVYSDMVGDISNMPYDDFITAYKSIIAKSCAKLKPGRYACFVVGEVRGKGGNFIGFVPDTIRAFQDCGMGFYNEAIILNNIASASMRANGNMKSEKLVKVHQNILVFRKAAAV